MTDQKPDPRPSPGPCARALPARAAAAPPGPDPARWLRGWRGREGAWTSLRPVEHWIGRAGA